MDTKKTERPAEVFHPGVYVRDEMEERGWSQVDLAEILGRPARLVSELLGGLRAVTPETARGLSEAFGTSAELWMNLQSAYDLWRSEKSDDDVSRRARLYSKVPIRDMIKRGWIEDSESLDLIEKQVCDFLEIPSLDHEPKLLVAARTPIREEKRPAQVAWFFRARKLGNIAQAERFTAKRLEDCMAKLRDLMIAPEESRHVPRVLSEAGIRFVVIEPLQKSRIDGATVWLDKQPVVALSMRYDRIDWFWHTLLHELEHVRRGDNSLDSDIGNEMVDDQEVEADRGAQANLIPRDQFLDFVARVSPLYSERAIRGFASTIGVHPGIVVGQLQFSKEISYAHSRALLVKIRSHVIQSALTDGWGSMLPSGI